MSTEIEYKKKFDIECEQCGSHDVVIENDLGWGSTWTGMYGAIKMICNDCKNEVRIYD